MKQNDLRDIYSKYFTVGYIGTDIKKKFAVISLICYIVNNLKEKNPDVTYYQIVNKLSIGTGMTEDEILGLSIVCEDFGYQCTTFPTFDIKPADMPKTIRQLLMRRLPF